MSDVIDQNIWYKIRHTPIRDALRGRLTARLDLRRALEESTLPPPIKQLLYRVVRATGLWRLEQLEVMQELVAHFTDGISSGVSADELIKAFGDEPQAAQLIRRAKRRNRPLPWYALRFAAWSATALLVLYVSYAIYFFTGRPSPGINYVAIVNSTVEKTPVEDRGWTFYRRALIGADLRQNHSLSVLSLNTLIRQERRTELADFVRTHQSEIAWIREGSTKAELGWVTGAKGSVNDAELFPSQSLPVIDERGESLSNASLPPIAGLRYLATMLRADAIVAGETGDGKRLLQDIHSTLNLSQQVGKNGPLLLSLISIAISEMAMEDVERALREHPTLIRKDEWLELSRRLSSPRVAADLFSFDPERMSLDDMLQRAFTDDGTGNGRMTAEGLVFWGHAGPDYPNGKSVWLERAIQPAMGLLVPSRRKLKEEYTQSLDIAESNLKLALREAKWPAQEIRTLNPLSISWAMPSYYRSQSAAERTLGRRDGVVTGIALELYRRKHGNYPESLNALVPELLTEVPTDRIAGGVVRYRLVEGRPVVYSVGADRKDDSGREPVSPQRAANWDEKPQVMPDGDWVLYTTLKR
jgi:hypothetical protein